MDEILPEATDTAVSEGKYVLTANLLSGEKNALLRALAVEHADRHRPRGGPGGWSDVDYMISALYQLVENGEVCKGLEARRPRRRHRSKGRRQPLCSPLTAAGRGYSIGAGLTQVAQLRSSSAV